MPVMSTRADRFVTPTLLRADEHEAGTEATITAGALAGYGAWVELIAVSSIHANYLNIEVDEPSSSNEFHFDIGIGALAAEVQVLSEVTYETDLAGNSKFVETLFFKVEIPKGVRIVARCKAVDANDKINIQIHLTGIEG